MPANQNPIKHTSQAIDNWSFDETYNQAAVEILTENAGGTALERQKTIATEETLQAVETAIDPLSKYKFADVDDDASPNYYGAVDKDGNWYILKEVISAGANTYRYAKGATNYETAITGAWVTRASQTYDYFHNVF